MSLFSYPPAWFAAVPAPLEVALLKMYFPGVPLARADFTAWFWVVAVWVASPLLAVFGEWCLGSRRLEDGANAVVDQESKSACTIDRLTRNPETELIPWLENECPIVVPRDDVFDRYYLGERIARRFFESHLPTIGLIGLWGSGKSSLLNMAERCLSDPEFVDRMARQWDQAQQGEPLRFRRRVPQVFTCKVSAWGFSDDKAAAVVLGRAIAELSRHVDCLAVNGLPRRYADSMTSGVPWWGKLPVSLCCSLDPVGQLVQLDPILDAIDARLIVMVEDLDRNEHPDAPAVSHDVEAMLDRLKDLGQVTFVLVTSRTLTDFSRLCEHIEVMPVLGGGTVWDIITAVRDWCFRYMQQRGDIQPAAEETLRRLGPGARDFTAIGGINGVRSPVSAIASLASSPRRLKSVLRLTWHVWKELHGEVDLDDLLICQLIRTVSPRAFDVLLDWHAILAANELQREASSAVKEHWRVRVTDCNSEERDWLWTLAEFVFSGSESEVQQRSPAPPQGARDSVYWERIVTGRLEPGVPDQHVLADLMAAKAGEDERLLKGLLAREQYAVVLERLGSHSSSSALLLDSEGLRSIAGHFFGVLLGRLGVEASGDDAPGFLSLWRVQSRRARGASYLAWLWQEVQKALPVSLGFANDLEYYWGSVPQHFLTMDQSQELRSRMLEWAKQNMDARVLLKILGRRNPWALSHFVIHAIGEPPPVFAPDQWRWLTPALLDALPANPGLLVPQVCCLLAKQSRMREADGQGAIIEYGLATELLEGFAPAEATRARLLEAITKPAISLSDLPSSTREVVDAVRNDAKMLLEEG